MGIIYTFFHSFWWFFIPLLLVAMGGMFSERSGIINVALNGIMLIGAMFSILFIKVMQKHVPNLPSWFLLVLAVIVAGAVGMAFSLLLAFSSINLKADQTIGGMALNLLAAALVIYLPRSMNLTNHLQQIQFKPVFKITNVPLFGKIPIIGPILFQQCYLTTFIAIILFAVGTVVMFKTKFGLRLRACGEHPQAADSVGINVYKMRYAGVLISGFFGGIGGLSYIISTAIEFNGNVAGYGYLALAVMIFGQWKPFRIMGAAAFFSIFSVIGASYSSLHLKDLGNVTSYVYNMLPFIATLIVIIFTSKNSRAPKAEGIPYDKGKR